MTTSNDKPEEWWILEPSEDDAYEAQGLVTDDPTEITPPYKKLLIHVIEYSAYERLQAENDNLKQISHDRLDDWKRIQDAERKNETLQSQLFNEETKLACVLVNNGKLQSDLAVLQAELEERRIATPTMNAVHVLQSQLKVAREALEFYAHEINYDTYEQKVVALKAIEQIGGVEL